MAAVPQGGEGRAGRGDAHGQWPPTAGRPRIRAAVGLVPLVIGAGWLVPHTGAKAAWEENLRNAMLGRAPFVAALIVPASLLAVPVIRRLTGRLTGRFGTAGRLARQNALRDPRRTAETAVILVIGTAPVAGFAIIGSSTAWALDRRAAAGLGTDCVISTRSLLNGIDRPPCGE
ncbi:hypothetical protein [Streptomyces sp. NPDC058770]|uniref:hypothetical protein n=1 Tax=unclassified Streptomyces TaxID=2593676 RepID=UPI0036AE008D